MDLINAEVIASLGFAFSYPCLLLWAYKVRDHNQGKGTFPEIPQVPRGVDNLHHLG